MSGLLTGGDVLAALEGRQLGYVVLPRAMFDADAALTLDDLTPQGIAQRLGAPVLIAENVTDLFAAEPVAA